MSGRLTRRQFLLGAGAAGVSVGAGALAGHLLAPATPSAPAAAKAPSGQGGGPLVVVTLYGGNDGLNTLVPYTDPAYHALRPNLGYSAEEVLDLDGQFGLNHRLEGLMSRWRRGQLAVVRGVGYPNPNLSHFESMDIWQTANPTDGTGAGWLGRWLDLGGTEPLQAISVGATLPPLLRGTRRSATAITGPTITLPGSNAFQAAFADLGRPGVDRQGLASAVALSVDDLLGARQALDARPAPERAAPTASADTSSLSAQLAVVAELINAGTPTQVYQVSLASFDTHAGEKADHERLLEALDEGIDGFLTSVAGSREGERTVVMTYSEFGRRPSENASGGTDHGAASVLFVAGPKVNGGRFYGEQPSLTHLDEYGNLIYNVDFRSVYATVLEQVVGVDAGAVLGGRYPSLGFV